MNYKEKLNTIKAFVFDVDGVLTDGSITLMPDGSMVRTMNVRDGYALQYAVKQGFLVGIITGGKDKMVVERLNKLGITDIYLNSHDKIDDLEDFIFKYNLDKNHILYMGDDIPDLKPLKYVGLSTCPKNAAPEIRSISEYISQIDGGKGCVRDIIEQTLKVQEKWQSDSKIQSV